MAAAALFIGWGELIPGRELKAVEVFGEAIQYYQRLLQQGQIESFEPVILEPHGGDLLGCLLVRGDQEKLSQVRVSEEFRRLTQRAQLVVSRVGVVGAILGPAIDQFLANAQQAARELGGPS